MKALFSIGFLVFLPAVSAAGELERFQELYEKEWAFRLQEFPEYATAIGVNDYNDKLTRVSLEDQERRAIYWRKVLEDLETIDTNGWSLQQRADYQIFHRQIRHFVEEYDTGADLIPLNSDWGFHMYLARLPSEVPLQNMRDYRNYLSRLKAIPDVIDEYIALMRRGIRLGFTQPKVVLDGREATIAAHVVDDVTDSVFYKPFANLKEAAGFSRRDVGSLQREGRSTVSKDVIPAYRKFLDFFVTEYVPNARDTLAAEALPGGEHFYQHQVKHYTTLDLTPDEIHEIGLREVARIKAEMQEIIAELEFTGSFAEFLAFLRSDEQFYAQTPRQLLMEAAYFSKKMDGKLPSLFKTLPRQPYGVEPVPADIAPTFTAGRYSSAPITSTRPGLYWVNTYDLKSRPLYALPALTLHEAVPGHHLQISLAQEQAQQPPFRRNDYISAYGEGWGLYSEWLGVEAGIYETPYQHFGRLTYEMWRACRLVVDTGVHTKAWTRQQALDYLAGNTALSLREVTTEVDRYISWPGQALSYKLGELKIKELRNTASEALGAEFDVREFHDVVLALGSVPLGILEEAVAEYIEQHEQ